MTLLDAYEKGGWLLAAAAGVTMLLRFWRLGSWQKVLPRWLQWEGWPQWVRYSLLFVLSLISAILSGLATGQPLVIAVLAALPVALGAHVAHKGTQAIGYHMTEKALAENWRYQPGPFRKAASIVLPINHDKVLAHNVAARTHAYRKPNR